MTGGAAPHISEMEFAMPLYPIMSFEPMERRFWAKVDFNGPNWQSTNCWRWTASLRHGYGQVSWRRVPTPAHRVAYQLLVGPIPEGLYIDHLCRNPSCVNPAHMEPVSHRENILRGSNPAAQNARKTHCIRGHPFNEINTAYEKKGRRCRTCRRRQQRAKRLH